MKRCRKYLKNLLSWKLREIIAVGRNGFHYLLLLPHQRKGEHRMLIGFCNMYIVSDCDTGQDNLMVNYLEQWIWERYGINERSDCLIMELSILVASRCKVHLLDTHSELSTIALFNCTNICFHIIYKWISGNRPALDSTYHL